MALNIADLSAIRNSFEDFRVTVTKVLGSEKSRDTFEQIFESLMDQFKNGSAEPGSKKVVNAEDLVDLSNGVDVIRATDMAAEAGTSANVSIVEQISSTDETVRKLERQENLSPQIGMSLRRAIQTEGHKWYQSNIVSPYGSASGYRENFGSHTVNGIEIIPGADGYQEQAAAPYLAQARKLAARYLNS